MKYLHGAPEYILRMFVSHDARNFVRDSAELPLTILGGTGSYFTANYGFEPAGVPVAQAVPLGVGGNHAPVDQATPLIDNPQIALAYFNNLNPTGQ